MSLEYVDCDYSCEREFRGKHNAAFRLLSTIVGSYVKMTLVDNNLTNLTVATKSEKFPLSFRFPMATTISSSGTEANSGIKNICLKKARSLPRKFWINK